MNYELPESLEVCGVVYPILSDYRAVLDIFAALSDPELPPEEKARDALLILYPAFEAEPSTEAMPPEHYQEALRRCFWFINGGEDEPKNADRRKLVDWQQDFPRIAAPISHIIGQEVRAVKYLHWWSFLSAYMEIGGDSLFAQIVRIRDLKSRGKKLDKFDREWYQRNRHLVDFETKYTAAETELLSRWM